MNEPTAAQSSTHPEAAPPPEALPQVNGYRILEIIARGGMGIVYKAVQESLGRVVALKMISAGGPASENAVRRFRAEAEVVARLRHPSIVPVHEIGVAGRSPFFTMDLIDGRSLAALVAEGPLPARQAAGIIAAAARAVAYAHGQGVVHRDLKPANILIDGEGRPWVTDFGLAKYVDHDLELTTQGAVLGTPSYMAPEQAAANDAPVTLRTDVYALGAVLYAMLTGRPPHVGGSAMAILQQVVSREPVAPRVLNPGIDKDLETVCLAAMRKAPERRYTGAADFGDDVERWLEARPVQARPPSVIERAWLWCRRRPAVAGLAASVVAVAALGLGGVLWQWREAVDANRRAGIARERQLASQIGALRVADPAAVPFLIDALRTADVDSGPQLRSIIENPTATGPERLRVALALLAIRGGNLDLIEAQAENAAPNEVMMIRSEVARWRAVIPDTAWSSFLERWWARSIAGSRGPLRAWALLAGWAPDDGRWATASEEIARRLVAEPAILLAVWIENFRPVAGRIVPGLLEILRDDRASEGDREQAEDLLAELASETPDVLVRCLLKSRASSIGRFLAAAGAAAPDLADQLRAELAAAPVPSWNDPPLPEGVEALPADANARLESAMGALGDRWAWAAAVEPAAWEGLVRDLGAAGHRLVRVRPYPTPKGLRIAAIWRRDGVDSGQGLDLTREAFQKMDESQQAAGRTPEDVACWFSEDPPELRFAGVWSSKNPKEERRLLAGMPKGSYHTEYPVLGAQRFQPSALSVAVNEDGREAVSSVWTRSGGEADFLFDLNVPGSILEAGRHPGRILADLVFRPGEPTLAFCGLWLNDSVFEDAIIVPSPLAGHGARAAELARSGWRPMAIAASSGSEGTVVASVWVRPAVTAASAHPRVRRLARAAVALAVLGDRESLPLALGGGLGPSVTIETCALLPKVSIPPPAVAGLLAGNPASGLVIGCLLALGSYPPESMAEPEQQEIGRVLADRYLRDPHSGVHSAAEWALRRLNFEIPASSVLEAQQGDAGVPTWCRDGEGHTLVRIRGPVEFVMGSPGPEEGRQMTEERHRRRIPRSFAVATKEVTVAQFRRFLDDMPELADEFPVKFLREPEEPMRGVNWLHATQYCRWLSEREGFKDDDQCYPKARSLIPEFPLPDRILSRKGYRLPTEAEWEYVARAGSAEIRWCGPDLSALDAAAWWRRNSESGPRPVGTAMPNGLGFFDVLGNLIEWCHVRVIEYEPNLRGGVCEEVEDPLPIAPGDRRILRGGSYDDVAENLRSSVRRRHDSLARTQTIGFRVARTIE